jgi:hypothetical protein
VINTIVYKLSARSRESYAVVHSVDLERQHKEKTMGRPLNKRYFGSGAGDQIKVRAKIGSNAEGDGIIVSQRGSKKFKVTVGGNTGDCFLVDKANGSLAANEMTITVLTDAGTLVRATKISAHRVSTTAGTSFAWTFDGSTTDGKVEMPEVETGVAAPVITISVQPQDLTVDEGQSSVFTVTAAVTQGGTLTYQWFINDTVEWLEVTNGGLYSGATTNTLTINPTPDTLTGYQVRVVVSSTGATPVTSDAATLTVTPV